MGATCNGTWDSRWVADAGGMAETWRLSDSQRHGLERRGNNERHGDLGVIGRH